MTSLKNICRSSRLREKCPVPGKAFYFSGRGSADEFYFIREGMVSVEMVIPHLGATTVQTLGEGEILGWSWVSPPYRWHFNAKTLKRTRALSSTQSASAPSARKTITWATKC